MAFWRVIQRDETGKKSVLVRGLSTTHTTATHDVVNIIIMVRVKSNMVKGLSTKI